MGIQRGMAGVIMETVTNETNLSNRLYFGLLLDRHWAQIELKDYKKRECNCIRYLFSFLWRAILQASEVVESQDIDKPFLPYHRLRHPTLDRKTVKIPHQQQEDH